MDLTDFIIGKIHCTSAAEIRAEIYVLQSVRTWISSIQWGLFLVLSTDAASAQNYHKNCINK